MRKSESIKALAAALSKTQSEMHGAKKDAENPFFKSKYADLESIWEAIRVPMTVNGLAVSQVIDLTDDGRHVVETMLLHSSGEWIAGSCPIVAKDNSAQAMGSAISYSRRYALAAILGVVQVDDDANAAQPKAVYQDTNISKPSNYQTPGAPRRNPSPAQIGRLHAKRDSSGWTPKDLTDYIKKTLNIDSTTEIPLDKYESVCTFVEKNKKAEKQDDFRF